MKKYKFKIIKKSERDFVIVNETLNTHSHLGSYWGCVKLIQLIEDNIPIINPYLQRACLRLTGKLTEPKQRYYNRSLQQRQKMGKKK